MSDDGQQRGDDSGAEAAGRSASVTDVQRKVHVSRELDRMHHVINRLHAQECRAAKRAQIAELRARDVESVRHAMERDAKVREQLMIEKRDKNVRQHDRVTAVREERKQRAESSRRVLRSHKLEMAKMTREQHSVINQCLSETNAERHDRCTAQHAIIRESEKQSVSARQQAADRKREAATLKQQRAADELKKKEEQLQVLIEQAEAMRRRVEESKSVELAASGKLNQLCSTGSPRGGGGRASSQSSSRAGGRFKRGGDQDDNGRRLSSSEGGRNDDHDPDEL